MNKKMKHVKLKNTAIIFELLNRQTVSDILNNKPQNSLKIITKHFKHGTQLHEELSCYLSLLDTINKKQNTASRLLEVVCKKHSMLNKTALKREKYNLISEIKKKYDINSFFKEKLPRYKLLAAIYKLFEYNDINDPLLHVDNYEVVLEHLTSQMVEKINTPNNNILTRLYNEDPEIKKLTFKFLIERFNNKYSGVMSIHQKKIINKFINEDINSKEFKQFIVGDAKRVKKELTTKYKVLKEVSVKIKIKEVIDLLDTIINAKVIRENHISALIKYNTLVDNV